MNRKSTSSLNSSLNQRDFPCKQSVQQFPRLIRDPSMPQGEAILNTNRRKRFPGKTEGTDSGVGEDEVQEADFNFTEFSYYREMEIFHSAVNEKYVSFYTVIFLFFSTYVRVFVRKVGVDFHL